MRIDMLCYHMGTQICKHVFRLLNVLEAILKNIKKGSDEW